MKNKFWLGLLAANALLLVTNSAVASADSISESQQDIASLSQTIAESIGLQPDVHSLIELAIGRALTAQKLGGGQATTPHNSLDQLANNDETKAIAGVLVYCSL
jgi:hypothetical protein